MRRVDKALVLLNTALLAAVLWVAGQRLLEEPPPPAQQWLNAGQGR